jgi:hypothetical protein
MNTDGEGKNSCSHGDTEARREADNRGLKDQFMKLPPSLVRRYSFKIFPVNYATIPCFPFVVFFAID